MKRITKRIISVIAVLALSVALAVPVMASGEINPVTSTQEIYLSSKLVGTTSFANILLADGTKDFLIRRSEVKVVPGKTGAKMTAFSKNSNIYNNTNSYRFSGSKEWQTTTYKGSNYNYYANIELKSPGTAKVSYKLGKKIYTSTIKVLPYENPVKSITMTGVNGGKSFASLTNSSSQASENLKITGELKNPKVDVVPAAGWKVSNVSLYGHETGTTLSLSSYLKPMSTATLACGKSLSKKYTFSLGVTLVNTSNKATINLNYTIGK